MMITRAGRLTTAACARAVFAALLALFISHSYAAERKPNFLFIYLDDQRWDAMSVVQKEQGEKGRFPWLKTPNMDRLAAEGVRFRNAFVTLPLCAPSRASFLTGQYNHLNGVANNHTPFPENNVTHASILSDAGYETAYIGKWHHNGQRGKRPGFKYSASYIGQGKYMNCPFEINGQTTQTHGWVDDVSTDFAIEYMKEKRDKPFSVIVGFKSCHGPFAPPERAKDRFAGESFRPVPNLDVTAIYREEDETTGGEKRKGGGINLNYFRTISAVDDNVGRLLSALQEMGVADDTVVVFTSDNGFYHGEHGLADKRSLYEESIRVPMLVKYPRLMLKGKVSDEMVLNIDIAPTFLELAAADVPKEMQGRSLVPLLTGKAKDWRKSFLAEYFEENNFPQTPSTVAVRTEDAKLIKYPENEEWTELFDLKRDPYETKNLAADSAHKNLRRRMEAEFDKQVKETKYRVPEYADELSTAPVKKKRRGR